MMKKNTLYLAGLLVVLLLVAYLVMQKPGETSSTSAGAGTVATIDSLAVDKIELRSPSWKLTLERRGAEWFIAQPISYRADQQNVAQLIQQCRNLQIKTVVSDKPEKHGVFQVDSTGTQVNIYERGVLKTSFILGKQGTAWNELYLRRANSNDVLLVDGASSNSFSRPIKDWRDKKIVSVTRDQIKEIKYQYGDTTFTVSYVDSTWKIGKVDADPNTVNTLLGSLTGLAADDFIDTTIHPAPKMTAQISFSGTQLGFSFNKSTNKYTVQASASPQVFVVEPWRANEVLKRKKDLIKK